MKPAPPQTSSLIGPPPPSRSDRPPRPSCQARQHGRLVALGAEHRVRGPPRRPRKAVGRGRQHAAAHAGAVEDLDGQLVPRAGAAARRVQDPDVAAALGELDQRPRPGARSTSGCRPGRSRRSPRRARRRARASCRRSCARRRRRARPCARSRARRSPRRPAARRRASSARRRRAGSTASDSSASRLAACRVAVEDVVGRDVDDARAALGRRARRRCPRPSPLTAVAAASAVSAPSTSVHAAQLTTARGSAAAIDAAHVVGVGDVELGAGEGDDVVPQPAWRRRRRPARACPRLR